jgi:TolA-binding protein
MAKPQKTVYSRLADAGEEAIQRLGNAPGGDRMLGAVNSMRGRMDDMQKQLRAMASIEKRLSSLERRIDKLEGKGTKTPARRKTTARKSTARKSTTSST